MKVGMVTDSLAHLSFDELLKQSAELGLDCVEFPTGNWSSAPHINIDTLLEDPNARREFQAKVKDHGLEISALTANGNPLHPKSHVEQDTCLRKTIQLANLMEIERVNAMSGLPGGPGDANPNWITVAWPPECHEILDYQWNEVAIPYWEKMVAYANKEGIQKICLELHGGQLVYNSETALRLRDAVGKTIGVNLDPSHLIWMGADPIACVRELGDSIYHVHAKDSLVDTQNAAVNTLLETRHSAQVSRRSWSYVTLGYGQDEGWWKRFCYALRVAGYNDVLSIEHEDVTLSRYEGVKKSVDLLRRCIAIEESDYELPDIG